MDPNRPNTGLALVGALLPLAFTFGAGVMLFAAFGMEGLARLFEGAGIFSYLVLLAGGFFSLVLIPLLLLIGRGRQLPVAIPIALATAPWWVGLGGLLVSAQRVFDAVAFVNPLDKVIIILVGLSEALGARVLGAWFASALLAGTAVGLGLCAGALRPKTRATVGLVAGVPALALFGIAILAMREAGSAQPLLFIGLPALAFAAAAGLGGLFLGVGVEDRPTSSAAMGAVIAGLFGLVAGVATFGAASSARVLEALADVSPEQKAAVVSSGLSGVVSATSASRWALGAGLVALVIVAALTLRRSRPNGSLVAGIGAALALVLGMIAVDASSLSAAAAPALGPGFSATASMPGVTLPVVAEPGEDFQGAALVVTGEGLRYEGEPVAITALQPGTPAHQVLALQVREELRRFADLHAMTGDGEAVPITSVIVDAKVDAARLSGLAALAKAAGAERLRFMTAPRAHDLSAFAGVPADLTRLIALTYPAAGSVDTQVLGGPDIAAIALAATVGPSGKTEVKDAQGKVVFVAEEGPRGGEHVALAAAAGVTVERFLDVASRLRARGHSVALIAAPTPPSDTAALVAPEDRGAE